MEQRSPEWFAARKGRVTGSVAGAILGCAPYMTRDDVLRSMVRAYHGAESEFKGNVATQWGTTMEPEAIATFEMTHGKNVQEVGFLPIDDWLGASPDGYIIGENAGLEVKSPYGIRKDHDPKFKTAAEQPHYLAQMQIEMMCAGWDYMYFYQWTPNGDVLEIVSRDDKWLEDNLPELGAFYDEYLSELGNPEHLEPLRVKVNTIDAKRLLDEYDDLKEAIDNANDRVKEIQGKLIEMSGEKNAEIWGRKLTYVERKGNVQYAKVPELNGVDLEPYRGKGSASWRLT